ncbi:lipase family protein [Rhodococcoides yunnanense]|uniref:lipase family protein n=1 Tax=Rhodococcoides yunnanense TaxID=278209 RepID=UPI000933068D|nr:lipase family protein [Rhodococcus yunnanensis]
MTALLAAVTVSCSTADDGAVRAPGLANLSPGELIGTPSAFQGYASFEDLTQQSDTIRYRSTSGIDGSPTEVSGVVFVPKGDPPSAGWPIASIGHSTSGSASRCAPSANIGLLGNLPSVVPFLANGYVVVMTDYQGLGTPGPHPYLEPITAGYNIIDAVRAARAAVPDTSDTWLGYGVSQGGQAVWAANELSDTYGDGLRLLGSVSVSPAADLTLFADAMENGTLTAEQITVLPALLQGLQVGHPELETADYLHGILRERADVFITCVGDKAGLQAKIAESVTPDDYRPTDDAAAQRFRDALANYSVPGSHASQPMLVAYGDQDKLVLPSWTQAAVREGCDLGDVIDLIVAPGQGHGILDIGSATADWVDGRVAGTPAPDACGR